MVYQQMFLGQSIKYFKLQKHVYGLRHLCILVNTLKILLIRIHSLHTFPKPVPKYKNVNKYI